MEKHIIASAAAKTRIANLIVTKINNAVSIYSEAPSASVRYKSDRSTEIIVKNDHSHILTFAEIDTIREVLDKFCAKYRGLYYIMTTMPYISKFDNETWLSQPAISVTVQRYYLDTEKWLYI